MLSFVNHHLILSGAESSQVLSEEIDESCSGADCASEATQVPSLLQKSKSPMASTVLPEDDDLTDEMAADLVMQELSKIGEIHGNEVQRTLAFNRQRLMLEEDEEAANRILDKDTDAEISDKISFTPPFPTKDYAGNFGRTSTANGKTTSGVVYYKIDDKFIYLAVASNWGFAGAGLNGRNPSMRNADIVVCRDWKSDGTVSARDFHATGNKAPRPDGAEDWVVTSSGIDGDITWCVMHRARVTCEIWEDYQAYADDTTLFGLVAWSNLNAVNSEMTYHGYHQRDVMSFNFMGPNSVIPRVFPPESKELKVVAPECGVPEQAGSYVCSYHILKVDDASKRHHIIQWRAIWDKGSPAKKKRVQHHMDLNACNSGLPVADGQLVDCAAGMAACGEVLLTGVSQYSNDGDWMDDDAGIAIGGDATVKVLFSIHFYNPGNIKGVRDHGTRFLIRYTEKLRPNNFMMLIMTTAQIEIPANINEHLVPSYCTRECTERLQGTTEIRFVGYHMHLAGKRTGVRVVRDGHEIEPIYNVDPWDDAMSAARIKRTIAPGDNLLGECVFKNPDSRIIPYGPELENEMCVITLSVVGPGSMKMCADLPLGQKAENIPDPCKVMKNGAWTGKYRPWPVCSVGVPMTFCPDAANKAGTPGANPMLDTAAGHSLKFVPWGNKKRRDCVGPSPSRELVPAEPGSCNHPATLKGASGGGGLPSQSAGGRNDACAEDATTHAVNTPNAIVGEIDVRNDLKVSWHTDCDKQVIDFIVEVKSANDVGWLALGLIDGGDATNPLGKSPNSMQGTDIVMLSPSASGANQIKDALGVGYVTPKDKQAPTATYVSGGRQCGYTYARFQRPFSAAGGAHELKPDGYVYLAVAYNMQTTSFGRKHDSAQAMRLKTSLFGGRGESYRVKDSKVKPESEPEPESEAEKKANKPIDTGKCPNPATTIEQCWAWAANAGVKFSNSKMLKSKKFPRGCFFNPNSAILTLNTNKKSKKDCSAKWNCVCESKHPEPEPEPEVEVAYKVKSGICGKLFTEDQCLDGVEKASGSKPSSLKTISSTQEPKGCLMMKTGDVVYNTATDSLVECHHNTVKACVCPINYQQITKAPAPAPGGGKDPSVPYKDTKHLHCVASNVVHADECKEKAEEYIKINQLSFTIKKFRTFSSSKWPEGCWILKDKKKVFFNTNTASTVKCGNGGSWCMCKASFVIAKKPEECTHVITSIEECEDAAKSQGYNLVPTEKKYKKKFPAGCWLRKNKLFFVAGTSIAKCGKKKTACICEA